MTFGEQLKTWRTEAQLNQRDFGAKVGIDFTYLSKIENGRMPPPSEATICKMAEVLEKDPDILLQLAQKVPQDLRPIISNSREAPALLRAIDGWNDDKVARLRQIAEDMNREK
jgi:HTH-type transcriptional regulator, competence development regulator